MNDVTMVGSWGRPHRSLDLSKIENGFQVKAQFITSRVRAGETYEDQVSRTFCFYTLVETIDFIRNYMDADASALRK